MIKIKTGSSVSSSAIQTALSGVDFGALAEADFKTQCGNALDTAIPTTPTALAYSQLIKAKLAYLAPITTAANTTSFACTQLIGFGDGYFVGWGAYVVWDAGGAAAAPQGEMQIISAYVSATGTFTIPAFTAAHAVTDKVMIIHPKITAIGKMTDAAATGAVGNTSSAIAYIKQLVTGQIAGTDGAAALAAVAYTRQAGVPQVLSKSIDLHSATTIDIAVATAQDCIIDYVFWYMVVAATAALTYVTIQTNTATTTVTICNSTEGAISNLTLNSQPKNWTEGCILPATKKIQLTSDAISGANPTTVQFYIGYHAAVSGGYLV